MVKFRIKVILAEKGLTIKALADKMAVTPQTIGQIINGKSSPNVSTLERIAATLEVPLASLFEDYANPAHTIILCPHCGGRIAVKTASPQ